MFANRISGRVLAEFLNVLFFRVNEKDLLYRVPASPAASAGCDDD